MNDSWQTGDWCWHARQAAPCRVAERLAALDEMAASVPELSAVMMVRIGDCLPSPTGGRGVGGEGAK